MTNSIHIEQRGAIEILSLNRPEKLNTMNRGGSAKLHSELSGFSV